MQADTPYFGSMSADVIDLSPAAAKRVAAIAEKQGKPAILRKPFDINSLGAAVAFALEGAPEDAGAVGA